MISENNFKNQAGGVTLWFTGLSGAGKSNLAEPLKQIVEQTFHKKCFILDGDIIRKGLNKDLGFSKESRDENIRRIAEVAKLFNAAGFVVISAVISPYKTQREAARQVHRDDNLTFQEVYIKASLECCEKRDVKGLYKKARKGEIPLFTGISDPYDVPENPEIIVDTENNNIQTCLTQLTDTLRKIYIEKEKYEHPTVEVPDFSKVDLYDVNVEEEALNNLQVIQQGWAPPSLKCFMDEVQLLECLNFKTFHHQYLQSLPIILPVGDEEFQTIKGQSKNSNFFVRLMYQGRQVGYVKKPSCYKFPLEEVCAKVFGTFSKNHPKIQKYISQNQNYLLTGEHIIFTEAVKFNDDLDELRLSADEVMKQIKERNADVVYAFQVRNPLHNGHCQLLKEARSRLINELGYKNPLLLLHPCGGWTKDDDVPLKTRVDQYKCLIEQNALGLEKDNTLLAIWPSPMWYAGPTEVMWHFASRGYAGINYMVIGRDPAGIKHPEEPQKNLYDPFHGQKVIQIALQNKNHILNVKPLFFKNAVYDISTKETKLVGDDADLSNPNYKNISGSEMRRVAKEDGDLPENFMNEKGWQILKAYYKSLS